MFGFGQLAGYDYFCHLEAALGERFERAGVSLRSTVVAQPATASLRRRSDCLAACIETHADDDEVIVLVGHSTGGLDARLLLTAGNPRGDGLLDGQGRCRVRAVAMLNSPHHGTPLAGYFATVSGTRLLYAMSLLTVASLSLGKLPLTAFASLVTAVGGLDKKLGIEVQLLDELTKLILRVLGDDARQEVSRYLSAIREDQGGIIQLMPEAMDVFNTSVTDRPGVRYGCVVSAAPAPKPSRLLGAIRSPVQALSAAVYATMHTVAGSGHGPYACPMPEDPLCACLVERLGELKVSRGDGVVPLISQARGELIWAGYADHLDVVGHFRDDQQPATHIDWLTSSARFGRREHGELCDALSSWLLDACK